jgi:DNA-binding NtrC family response regulator
VDSSFPKSEHARDAMPETVSAIPSLLMASADRGIRDVLSGIIEAFSIKTSWVKTVKEARALLQTENFAASVCGFWLEDGTYREIVRHLKRQPVEIPLVMISPPGSANEYRDYLSALKVGAFDFICRPYQKTEVERILRTAVGAHYRSARAYSEKMGTSFRTPASWPEKPLLVPQVRAAAAGSQFNPRTKTLS